EANEAPTPLNALSAETPFIAKVLGAELCILPLSGPNATKAQRRVTKSKTTMGSTKSCFLICLEGEVAISKFSFRFRPINNIPLLIVYRNVNFCLRSVYFSELTLVAYKRVTYPSYRKYSSATSCGWGVFVSATWG